IPKGFNALNQDNYSSEIVVKTALQKDEVHLAYGIEKMSKTIDSPAAWIFVHESVVSILIAKNKTLVFANAFNFHDQTELLYFIVNALHISEIKQDEVNLYLDFAACNKF